MQYFKEPNTRLNLLTKVCCCALCLTVIALECHHGTSFKNKYMKCNVYCLNTVQRVQNKKAFNDQILDCDLHFVVKAEHQYTANRHVFTCPKKWAV